MKEYSIKLRLTATEAEQLVKAAAQHDQKVSELLESFVYDLDVYKRQVMTSFARSIGMAKPSPSILEPLDLAFTIPINSP